ncbi:hypothetical protein [Neomegalonema sp.]|uniref:hypothetical protein n=1 Tax=Neomegalonema sp. TaxID=2039713 RepID=UPI00262B32FE|nr:hypothetical protein [Neomegalonema sp.]MDD2867533.1 hypothetical protein [Neomegalonema sp.]
MTILGGLVLAMGAGILVLLLRREIDRRDLHGVAETGGGLRALADAGVRALLRRLGWFCVVAGIALILLDRAMSG